jgi:hypothetical protein
MTLLLQRCTHPMPPRTICSEDIYFRHREPPHQVHLGSSAYKDAPFCKPTSSHSHHFAEKTWFKKIHFFLIPLRISKNNSINKWRLVRTELIKMSRSWYDTTSPTQLASFFSKQSLSFSTLHFLVFESEYVSLNI